MIHQLPRPHQDRWIIGKDCAERSGNTDETGDSGPNGEISDYAAKQWGGLVSSYHVPRWRIFVEYLKSTSAVSYNATTLQEKLLEFELNWQKKTWAKPEPTGDAADLQKVLAQMVQKWPSIFGSA